MPTQEEITVTALAFQYQATASLYEGKERISQFRAVIPKLADLASSYPSVYVVLGRAFLEAGNYELAVKAYLMGLSEPEGNFWYERAGRAGKPFYYLGRAYWGLNMFQDASQQFEVSLSKGVGELEPMAHRCLGIVSFAVALEHFSGSFDDQNTIRMMGPWTKKAAKHLSIWLQDNPDDEFVLPRYEFAQKTNVLCDLL